jgi:hypothetical protein
MYSSASSHRPRVFGAGVSVGMLAGILLGSLVTLWLGDAAADLAHRMIDRLAGHGQHVNWELLEQ